jgi:regulatory protein
LRIREALRMRGVEGELINHYIDNGAPEWDTHIARVRAKRFGSRVPEERRERVRQARFLQYRGFTHDQIRRLIRIGDG